MNQSAPNQQPKPLVLGYMLTAGFVMFQVMLIVVLKFVLAPEQTPSFNGFLTAVSGDIQCKIFLGLGVLVVLAQQFAKARLLEGAKVTLVHLIILLAMGEIPGLMGIVAVILKPEHLSFGIPMIFMSIISFMTLKPIIVSLPAN